jgi:hypothetical protein
MMARRPTALVRSLQHADESLVDLVDNLLNRGVILDGALILGLANVDLIYLRLSLLLSAADRVLASEAGTRRRRRR